MKEPNRDGIKLSQLRALVAVAEYGNFSEAALHLEVSQSAVSHAIASLESELGVILLSRGRHGANTTPVGERVLHHARQMLQLLEAIDKEANLAKGLEGGQVRILAFRSFATHVLPGIVAQFRSAFPGISVTISEFRRDDGVETMLRGGRADISFTCLPTSDDFESWELLRDEYLVLLPPDCERSDEPMTWEELASYPLILPVEGDYCSILIREHFAKHRQPLKAAYEIMEDSTMVSMVMKGLGATIMARLAAEPLPPEICIRRLPVPLERVIQVAILSDALHTPAVYAFLDTLKKMSQLIKELSSVGS